MLFKFLKLFGLDVPAQMEAAKASLDLRLEDAKDGFTRMAVQAAVIAALFAFAAIAGAMALGVALFALYQGTAEEAGVYAGLGAVGAPSLWWQPSSQSSPQSGADPFVGLRSGPMPLPQQARPSIPEVCPLRRMGVQRSLVRFWIPRTLQCRRPQRHPSAISWSLWPSSCRRS
jgi:hypothetical protein